MLHITFADELIKALHHYGLDSAPVEVSYGNHQTVIIVTTPDEGKRVGITVEEIK
jgi:hypothetical protein